MDFRVAYDWDTDTWGVTVVIHTEGYHREFRRTGFPREACADSELLALRRCLASAPDGNALKVLLDWDQSKPKEKG